MSISVLLIIAIAARVVSNPVANVFQKQLTRDGLHPLFVNLLSYFLLALISIPLIGYFQISELPLNFWVNAILGGLFGSLGNGYIVKALEYGELSVLGPINSYKSVIGVVFAFILIGELPNAYGMLGIGLIIFGSYFVLRQPHQEFTWNSLSNKAVKYRIAGLLFTGIEAVFDKKVIQSSGQVMAFVAWSIFGVIFSYIFFLASRLSIQKEIKNINGKMMLRQMVLILAIVVMIVSTNFCFSQMPVGESLALFQLSILISLILGYRIFGETNIIQK